MANKRLQAAKVGISTLKDWLGDGGIPVDQGLAESRSVICETCPQNWQGDWWTMVTAEAAMLVMEQRRMMLRMKLRLPNENSIGTCKICLCHLPTKAWIPIEHILKHTTEEVWNQLPPFCWIKREGSELRSQKPSER